MKKRNVGIDLLRVLSMGMIVILHLLSHGQIMNIYNPGSAPYLLLSLLEAAVYCAVNVFAMISGYVMVNGIFRPKKMIGLWGQVFFYSAGITLLIGVFNREWITAKIAIKSICPVLFGHYWYFTAYFALFVFTPYLNELVKGKQAKNLLVSALLIFSVLPTLVMQDPFKTDYGFSFVWLSVCYFIGAYISINQNLFKMKSEFYFAGYLCTVVLAWISKVLIQAVALKIGFPSSMGYYLLQYPSPLVILSAAALIIAFSKMRIHNDSLAKVITWMGSGTFAVYLIHEHSLIKNQYMPKIGLFMKGFSLATQIMFIPVFAVGILMFGIGIDYLRRKFFGFIKGIIKR